MGIDKFYVTESTARQLVDEFFETKRTSIKITRVRDVKTSKGNLLYPDATSNDSFEVVLVGKK